MENETSNKVIKFLDREELLKKMPEPKTLMELVCWVEAEAQEQVKKIKEALKNNDSK